MREALARTDLDFTLRGESDRASPRTKKTGRAVAGSAAKSSWRRRLIKRPVRTFASAAFGALLCGIVVNAIALQHGHRPVALFGRPARANLARSMARAPAPPKRPADLAQAPRAPAQPAERSAAPSAPIEKIWRPRQDEIGELIATGAPPERHSERMVAAVQRALAKLGFQVKATGVLGFATRQAVEKFERSLRLPISGDLSPRVIHALSERSGLPIPRQ
ncbi:MAG TPA: peptidoglycan-binding domain-containing protein [Beijerinckiaceae bacterium]|nr:peptidoglycan-binding domain-containing protein [Beijerinckiaceae bacterium]